MRIIIVDDDKLVAMSLKTIVEADVDMEVPATGNSADDAYTLYKEHKPDVLLMDIRMGEVTGLDAAERILKEFPDAKILFLTTFNDDEYIIRALSIGASGYIIKQDFDSIVPSIRAIYGGQTVFGNEVTDKLSDIFMKNVSKSESVNAQVAETGDKTVREKLAAYGITEQEMEVIKAVSEGLSNKEIADKMYLSEGTVRNYISTILSKLGLRDRTNLAIFYYKELR